MQRFVFSALTNSAAIDEANKKGDENFLDHTSSDVYYTPFKLACESKTLKTALLGLNAICKLASSHYLSNRTFPDEMPEDGTWSDQKALVDDAVDTIVSKALISFAHNNDMHDAAITALSTLGSETTEVHGEPLRLVVQTLFQLFSVTRVPKTRDRAATAMRQLMAVLFTRMESVDSEEQAEVYLADCVRMFIGLCRKITDTKAGDSPVRAMALSLLHTCLSNARTRYSSSPQAISAAHRVFLLTLLEALNGNDAMFESALDVVLKAFKVFGPHLKTELGALLDWIMAIMADNAASTGRKRAVLDFLRDFVKDSANPITLFLNYDCDSTEPNLLGEMVVDKLGAVVSTGPGSRTGQTAVDAAALQRAAASTLLAVIESFLTWSTRPPTPSELEEELGRVEASMAHKTDVEKAIYTFNNKTPKRGLEQFISIGVVEDTPAAIAHLLVSDGRLAKAAIGDLLGEGKEYYRAIMYAFVDILDFTGMKFLPSLRLFLDTFILPGEAQKIDRLAQKFADRWYLLNKDRADREFQHCDTIYSLAMATILLNSDLHSPSNPRRMTQNDFCVNTKGIDHHDEMTRDILAAIYDEISVDPIRADPTIAPAAGDVTPEEAKDEQIRQARGLIARLRKRQGVKKEEDGDATDFVIPRWRDYGAHVFGACAWSILATLSITLETAEEPELIRIILQAFSASLRVASAYSLPMFCEVFVSALCKFTHLNTASHISPKNIEVINVLADLAQTNSNDLGGAWRHVLRCLSQLDRLHMINAGSEALSDTLTLGPSLATDLDNSRSVNELLDRGLVDRIFQGSVMLNEEVLVTFVKELTAISAAELDAPNGNHRFSLQKIVEVVTINMDRDLSKFAFIRLWRLMGNLFTDVGSHSSVELGMYAVDSLRQLAQRFLRRFSEEDEFASLRFQELFLKPFDEIVCRTEHAEVVEFVLRCIQQFIQTEGVTNIRSGWAAIFSTLSSSVQFEASKSTIQTAGLIAGQIVHTYFPLVVDHIGPMRTCLDHLRAQNVDPAVSGNMVGALARYLEAVITRPTQPDAAPAVAALSITEDTPQVDAEAIIAAQHVPIIQSIALALGDSRDVVCRAAAAALFGEQSLFVQCLDAMPHSYTVEMLSKTIIEPVADASTVTWSDATLAMVLQGVAEVLVEFAHVFSVKMPEYDNHSMIYRFAKICCDNAEARHLKDEEVTKETQFTRNERLAEAYCATVGHHLLLDLQPDRMDPAEYLGVMEMLRDTFVHTIPADVRGDALVDEGGQRPMFHRVRRNCVLQLQLVSYAKELITDGPCLPMAAVDVLLDGVAAGLRFSREFNSDLNLRFALWRANFMSQLPSMRKQELRGSACLISVLDHLLKVDRDDYTDEWRQGLLSSLIEEISTICSVFADRAESAFTESTQQQRVDKGEVAAFIPVVGSALQVLVAIDDAAFVASVGKLYGHLVRLIRVTGLFPNNQFGEWLTAVFTRIGPMLAT